MKNVRTLLLPFRELCDGLRTGTIPLVHCLTIAVLLQIALLIYPTNRLLYIPIVTLPFWGWALYRSILIHRMVKRLTEVFRSCGLQNNLGRLPNFVFDRPLDATTRKLRLTRAVLPLSSFEKARDALQGGLQIHIDEIRENRVTGTVDVVYAHSPMVEKFAFPSVEQLPRGSFVVGTTRSKQLVANLHQVPHLLVAGQTGGGKSTFLRQLITTLYLRDDRCEFALIDLKGGLEFQIFENLPRVHVVPSIADAISTVDRLSRVLESRMALLKEHKCKDIVEFYKLPPERRAKAVLNRRVVVVDEAAEMFLAGHHASAKDIQTARRSLSQVARQGRSIGIHLVIATQRPDSRALDPQVKANLTGVLCFQMANDISSITVLGNGRATDLPPVPGRAIWKSGVDLAEVQTPYLSPEETETMLRKFYVSKSDSQIESMVDNS